MYKRKVFTLNPLPTTITLLHRCHTRNSGFGWNVDKKSERQKYAFVNKEIKVGPPLSE